jgi:hypothetical protein
MDISSLLNILLIGAGTMLALILTLTAPKLRAWLAAQVTNESAKGILDRLTTFVLTVVSELNQTVVADLKTTGTWNKAEAARVKQMALSKVMSYIGPEGVKVALEILGIDNARLQELISSFIESQVGGLKSSK